MFKLLSKVYAVLSYSGRYIRQTKNNKNIQHIPITCNAFRNINCRFLTYCKNLATTELNKKGEESFMCEVTNKPKRKGNKDCTCEEICIVSQSETRIIHDGSSYKGEKK